MRSITPRVFRRLLLVGGLALAGWLLSGAGQAHAAAGDGLDPGAGAAAIGSLPDAGAPARPLAHGHTGRLAAIAGRPRAIARDGIARAGLARSGITRDGLTHNRIARGVIGTAVRPGDLVRRAERLDPVAALPAGRPGAGPSRAPRHRVGAVPGHPAAATPPSRPPGGVAHHGGARPTAPVAVTGTGRRCGHAGTAPATPAPPAGLPRSAAGETGALPSAGSPSAAGLAGHTTRPEAAPRPSSSLRSVLGAVPPAVHTAADEPAVSPD